MEKKEEKDVIPPPAPAAPAAPVEKLEEKKEEKKKQKAKKEKKEKKDKKDKKEKPQKKEAKEAYVKDPNDPCASKFGDVELIRSQCDPEERFKKIYTPVCNIGEDLLGKEVRIRARLHNSRIKGKMGFIILRESFATLQAVMMISADISKGMMKYADSIPKESLIEIVGIVTKPNSEIKGCTQKLELALKELWTISKSCQSFLSN